LLKALIKVGSLIGGVDERWAVGGSVGEMLLGVNATADHLDILSTKKGCIDISTSLNKFQVVAPGEATKELERSVTIDDTTLPVFVKSEYAEFLIDGVKLEVYGDLQVKVGELEWGEPFVFQPTEVYIVGSSFPILPLALKGGLYMGLGWMDRAQDIFEAMKRSQPHP
jgi:hypothetical protein